MLIFYFHKDGALNTLFRYIDPMFGLRTEVNIEDPIQNCQKLPNKDVQLIKTTYPGLYCHCGQQEKLGGAQLSF